MSGTIPGFADVVLNFGSKRLEGDNLMEQWKRSGRNMTMYGDDTWIKLFPEHFMRHDGTTSFFVSDYTEVDQNVTRHLTDEVHRDDWDVSVLHYLGLDHIGHLDGPDGSAVPEKLDEMGQIVKFLRDEIVLKKDKWKRGLPPLLVVLGDHGMADAGGHGGASVSEVMTPMIFLTHPDLDLGSPRFKEIKQTDLVPTLAWLTGVPIPRNNIGTMIFNDKNDDAVFYNALQVSRYVKDTELESMLKNATFYGSKVIVVLEQMIASVEENLTDYNMSALLIGIALIYLVFF
jgi:ethanolaminephosphotransferase